MSRRVIGRIAIKTKPKNNSLLKGIIFIGVYVLISFILEIINFVSLGFGALPSNMFFDFAFWMVVAGLLFLIPNNVAKIVVEAVFLAVQIFINLVNATLIRNTGLVFHWHQITQTGNAATSLEPDMINWGLIVGYILIFLAFLTVTLILNKKLKNTFDFNFKKRVAFWLSSVLLIIALGSSFVFIGNAVRNDVNKKAYAFAEDGGKSMANGVYLKNATMRVMGTFGFYFHDMVTQIEASKTASAAEIEKMKELLKTGIVKDEEGFHAKDDNLIYILLESFDVFSIDPYNTPNLWKLAYGGTPTGASDNVEWGATFENFYGLNYTNNSEYISLTGHTTEKNTFADYYKKTGIAMPYSLPHLFKNANYKHVNFFHSYNKTYYNRDDIYDELGFDNVYGLEDANIDGVSKKFGNWVLDSEYIDAMMEKFIPENDSFFSYFTTVSTHGPYTKPLENFSKYLETYDKNLENYKKFLEEKKMVYPENKKDQAAFREYKARVMDIDLMVGNIFNRLAKLNILDKTTIVLFSDHTCFYNDLNGKIRGVDNTEFSNIEINNIPFIIYNNEIRQRVIETFCNTYDIYATICHMFGFEYNKLLTQGYSVFKGEISKSVHISFKHGIFNEDYYTDDLIKIKKLNENPLMKIEDFKTYAYEFFKEQEIIEFVYANKLYQK